MAQQFAENVIVANDELKCQICGHNRFFTSKAQLNTRMLTFLNLDFFNHSALCHTCEQCGYVHWFLTT